MEEFTPRRQEEGTATAICNLKAGLGKTFVAAAVIHTLRLPTLYVVPTDYLADQAIKDLRGCFPAEEITIFRWNRAANKKTCPGSAHIIVSVVNSVLREPKEFFHRFGLIVLDEVHTYCTETRKQIFKTPSRCILGMSATTDERKDTFDGISHWHLTKSGKGVIYTHDLPGWDPDDSQFSAKVTVIKYHGEDTYTQTLTHPSTGKMFTPWMNKQFLADSCRTQVMLGELRRLYDWIGPAGQRHKIFVFCEEREPLSTLKGLLSEVFSVSVPEMESQVGTLVGGCPAGDIQHAKTSARVILTTYGYSSTGISIKEMTAMIFWTPRRSNMQQILARILRRGGDETITREVIDLVDQKTPMRSQHYERRNAYAYYSMTLETKKVHGGTQ